MSVSIKKSVNKKISKRSSLKNEDFDRVSGTFIKNEMKKVDDSDYNQFMTEIKKEIKDGIIPDPNIPIDPATGAPLNSGTASIDLGQPVMEPEIDGSATEVNGKIAEIPKGGEI